eukprot:7529801-Ditylum_brightwellii.AAC.1
MSEQKDEMDKIELEFLDKDDNVIKNLDSGEDDMLPLALRKDEEDEDEDEDYEEDETSPIEDAREAILDTPKQNLLDESSSPENEDSGEIGDKDLDTIRMRMKTRHYQLRMQGRQS